MFHAGHRQPDLAGELRPRKAAQTVEDLESKLDEAKTTVEAQEKRLADAQSAHQAQAVVLAQIRERLMLTEEAARTATEDHAAELARLNASIEAERGRYQQQSEQTRADMAEQRKLGQEATSERDQARAELAAVKAKAEAAEQTYQEHRKAAAQEAHRVAERMTKAVSDRDEARREASSAREDAAKLRGQVEALQTQANDLMRALVARQPPEENDHPL